MTNSNNDPITAIPRGLCMAGEPNSAIEGISLESARPAVDTGHGVLIVNADDWGRDAETTNRTLQCVQRGAVSSVSAMVFMQDSERAAAIAREQRVDAGLHLNFTTAFSSTGCPPQLAEHQNRLARFLSSSRLAQVMYHPGLTRSFEYVVAAQIEEFSRQYGAEPHRMDGHHHMHLCANVLLGKLLPAGTIVRRNFTFGPHEKSWGNRLYRRMVDSKLARRHRLADCFFSLAPFRPSARLERIFSAARQFVVELETHPVESDEYQFLAGGEIFRWTGDLPIASRYEVASYMTGLTLELGKLKP